VTAVNKNPVWLIIFSVPRDNHQTKNQRTMTVNKASMDKKERKVIAYAKSIAKIDFFVK